MNLSGSQTRLIAATKDLSAEWAHTKHYWRDHKSREFEQRYLEELAARVERTVTVIEKLDKLLRKIRSECE
jgi:hypothetical protein